MRKFRWVYMVAFVLFVAFLWAVCGTGTPEWK